ncbi:hypothetical protein BH23ACT1_BH23ACT1_02420 [soil metagenome]
MPDNTAAEWSTGLDAISYFRILAGRWRIIALICFIGLLAGWVTTPGAADRSATGGFSATHILRVDTDPSAGAGVEAGGGRGQAGSDVGLTALLATTGEVPTRVAAELNADVADLQARVTTDSDPTLGTLSITALDPEANRAAEIADTFALELLELLSERAQERYTAELEEARVVLAELQARLDELPPVASSGRVDVENAERAALLQRFTTADQRVQELEAQGEPSPRFVTLQEAVPQPAGLGDAAARSSTRQPESARRNAPQDSGSASPAAPAQDLDTAPERTTRMLIGGAVGLLLGLGLALLRERLDPRIRTREDAERAFGLPVLAEVPRVGRGQRRHPQIATVDNGRALEAESYRVLATSLLFQRSSHTGEDGAGLRDEHLGAVGPATNGSHARPSKDETESLGLIETSDDVHRATHGLPLLGRVPASSPPSDPSESVLAIRAQPHSPAAEAYRWLGIPLGRASQDGPARTLSVTSAAAGEESAATVANLGMALARDGQRVVVIDGDLRHPRLHTFFDLPNTVGLTSVVSGEVSLSVASQPVTGEDGLAVISTGPLPPDPHELLASPRIGEVLAALTSTVDVVIVVAPPVLAAADAAVLAKQVGGTVVVATSSTTAASQLRRAVDSLQGGGASLVGVVLHERAQTKRSMNQPRVSLAPASQGDVVLVTSPGAKEGKSSASVNLAAALAEAGKSVVALDFDLRRPRLHEFFGEDPHRTGLTDVLALSGLGPTLEEVVRPTAVPEVRVALSGSAVTNPSELLPGARQLIAGARCLAQAILIDTPPVLVTSDAVQLIPAADVVVMVCRTGTTRTTEAARARQLLARLDAPVVGLVLLGVQPSSGARSYYYDHARRPFWSRSGSPRQKSEPIGRGDATRSALGGAETSVKAATGQGEKAQTKPAGPPEVTRDPHKALRGKAKKKAKQRS